jgi:hypothetical protein
VSNAADTTGADAMTVRHDGGCLCGAVRYVVTGDLSPPDACHCSLCRRQSGHYWASTDILRDNVALTRAEHLRWYQSSEKVRRGFCGTCGSVLLWDVPGRARLAIAMGSFDAPTGAHLEKHIFTADKGDYYDIADGLPQE